MNIESLRYFYMIANAGNISGVAKEVHLTQSALSQQLQKLENDLGSKLLVRSNKGVMITDAGKIVLTYAQNILRTYDTMREEISQSEDNVALRIEACNSVADYALPCTLIIANRIHPKHKYELTGNRSSDIITNVANNICDIGFISGKNIKIEHEDIIATKVGVNDIALISNNNDSFPDSVTIAELLECCLITFTENNYITSLMNQNLRKLGYDQENIKSNLSVEGIQGAKMLISKDFGMAFLPYISVKEELYKKQFKTVKFDGFDMQIDIIMLYKKNSAEHIQDFVNWFIQSGAKSFC